MVDYANLPGNLSCGGGDFPNNQTLSAKKVELLGVFFWRYDWGVPLELAPSDSTFQIIARARRRRIAEFIPLSRANSAADVRACKLATYELRARTETYYYSAHRKRFRERIPSSRKARTPLIPPWGY